ncbi:Rieske (2Fe-2S) protein [Nocardioides sp.]|uniref:Rieske (2Fe-2S) protein n=1 Tax=Nocardioides sp. TaxID=35761 RepID=UPI002C1CF461|nr:Rieske (2Fe-2S) protein [Nocardioides sp.]HSX65915.1 Rieske (2Fe-2S) protein [Nocardioides sp.]
MTDIGPASDLPRGSVTGVEKYAVGNNGDYFAVTRKCRHLGADLAEGTISADGCLVCPWHKAEYDVTTGQMVKGPGGVFARIPGLGAVFKQLTRIAPLGIRPVVVRNGRLHLDDTEAS